MVTKRCCWGTCSSDSRYKHKLHMKCVYFLPFPKPKTSLERCKLWVSRCGRPHQDLAVERIKLKANHFVCSKHFPNGASDPVPATYPNHISIITSNRKRPAERREVPKPIKKRVRLFEEMTVPEQFPPTGEGDHLPVFHDIIDLTKQEEEEPENNKATQTQHTSKEFANFILSKDSICFQYTGVPTIALFYCLFHWILPGAKYIKLWDGKYRSLPRNIKSRGRKRNQDSLFLEMLICLVKIRMDFGHNHLSYFFGLSSSHISRIFISWTNFLHQCLKSLIIWPSSKTVKDNLPLSFSKYPNTKVIIDCTEYFVQKPLRPAAQKVSWSNYKQSNTFKQLVGISPNGTITFISNIYAGSISDAKIVQTSGFLDHVQQGDDIMADRGFNIRHLLLPKKATL